MHIVDIRHVKKWKEDALQVSSIADVMNSSELELLNDVLINDEDEITSSIPESRRGFDYDEFWDDTMTQAKKDSICKPPESLSETQQQLILSKNIIVLENGQSAPILGSQGCLLNVLI